ncbi:tetraacyldisaccharide 4'-kinase [Usitatibacter palustris]|uniref:Tetraacyldisaccharide 4'-kinase n=1 Tax=Usitatibacter palustris TaxID=2732487 RepID=A0A6M4H8E4_9PROT|nr:tetraacyldisaccharide 4'-kinase [Usitatibacter palustris]QJR15979.1 Tetraacyldisaccharide 4'-kinase [Usitatibacter palustris]
MQAWFEREWQRLGGGALVMLPFTILFMAATWLRRKLYAAGLLRAWRARVPVIIVGNITAGGSGKTPLVIAVVETLRERGWTPGVVARGYGRVPSTEHDPSGVVRVFPEVATPEHFGDEPVLIARRLHVPVFISPDRPAAVRALLEAVPETDVVVSDDGLQHYALARDVELAVVDGERRFGNGLLLPSGPLREPVSRLAGVDAAIVNGGNSDAVPAPRQFAMRLGKEVFVSFSGEERTPADFALAARGLTVAAVAGIGYPPRFFDHLGRLGVAARAFPFPDHYHFHASDLRMPGVELIVMTEKDAVKCTAFADERFWFLRVSAVLPPEFDAFLLERLAAARRATKAHGPEAA